MIVSRMLIAWPPPTSESFTGHALHKTTGIRWGVLSCNLITAHLHALNLATE